MKSILLATSLLSFHLLFGLVGWFQQNWEFMELDPKTRWTLGLCLAVALVGLWIVWRARRPSKWDWPARSRAERQAAEKARQKAHEHDGRAW